MSIKLYKSNDRGKANLDWLQANHSFSFGHYFNPDCMNFGLLRVLNDDTIAPSKGFDTHPHNDMEIVTIPLEGALTHKDDMGHESVICHGDVQVMSAGTGVLHSEFNASDMDPVKLLQIWVDPNKKGLTPRYDQKTFEPAGRHNTCQLLVSPDGRNGSLSIHQSAFFSLVELSSKSSTDYSMYNEKNGIYLFLISGAISVLNHNLGKRDAVSIQKTPFITLKNGPYASLALILEVPLK